MGQKTNPKAFRLVTTEKHLSNWYSTKENYSIALQDDYIVRENVQKIFNEYLTLSNIEISRRKSEYVKNQIVDIRIFALFPRAKEMYKKVISYFEKVQDTRIQKALTLLINRKAKLTPFVSLLLKRLSSKLTSQLQK